MWSVLCCLISVAVLIKCSCVLIMILVVGVILVGIAAGSGMAATTMICQLLKTGDHIVAMDDLYGGRYMCVCVDDVDDVDRATCMCGWC